MNATAVVVENKLTPIAGAVFVKTVTFTAQAAINLFGDFRKAQKEASGAVCKVLVSTLMQSGKSDAAEFQLATKGLIESTRVKQGEKTVDGKDTPLARKFVSMVRSVYGAVRFAGFSLETIQNYTNSQDLYDDCRGALDTLKIDWKGVLDADKAKQAAGKALSKAAKAVADDEGVSDVLSMTPEQFAEVQTKAKAKLAEAAMVAKLKSMETRAKKIVKDLVESYGLDDAEMVLKGALEHLSVGTWQ